MPASCSRSGTAPSVSVEPGLDPAYESAAAARAEVEQLLARDGASGVAAIADGELTGFLVGAPRDASWGPNVWVEPAGHAVSDAELVRDLYAEAAAGWFAAGLTSHYAIVPATDPALVDAWFRLGFGHQHVHAIREPWPAGEEPRRASGAHAARTHARRHRRARRADLALPRAPGPRAGLLAPARAVVRGGPRRARGRLRRPALHDVRRRTGRRRRRGRPRLPIEVSSMHTSLALPRAPGSSASPPFCPSIGASAPDACSARPCSRGRATQVIRTSSPTGA